MLVLTKYRALAPLQDFSRLVSDASAIYQNVANLDGSHIPSCYYNECGPEIVIITKINSFAELDQKEQDAANNEIGLRLLKAGFAISSVEYLREFPGTLPQMQAAFNAL